MPLQTVPGLLGHRPALTVPWRTLAGLSGEPGHLGRIGPVSPATACELARAAARDPTCSWQLIIVDTAGQPITVTRVRPAKRLGPGPLAATQPGPLIRVSLTIPAALLDGGGSSRPGPPGHAPPGPCPDPLAAALATALTAAQAALSPSARAGPDDPSAACQHDDACPGYRIPARLRTLVETRDRYCGYPICRRPATSCDLDHVIPYDQGGLTCTCNLHPACRHHHRLKTHTRWKLCQPRPGTLRWTSPAGLTWTTSPEPYPA